MQLVLPQAESREMFEALVKLWARKQAAEFTICPAMSYAEAELQVSDSSQQQRWQSNGSDRSTAPVQVRASYETHSHKAATRHHQQIHHSTVTKQST